MPRPISAASRLWILGFTLCLVGCGSGGGGSNRQSSQEGRVAALFEQVNQVRISRGLPSLAWTEQAAWAATRHAEDLRTTGTLVHVNDRGEDPGDRLATAGLGGMPWGENVGRGTDDPSVILDSWLASPRHREVLLHPAFTHVGIGVSGSGDGMYWVQDFVARE